MDSKKITKLVLLNMLIGIADSFIFSKGLLGIQIGSSAFHTAFGITAILMSIVIFAYGNNKLLFEQPPVVVANALKTPEDCILALKQNTSKKTFTKNITFILEQTERFNKKKATILDILLQKFTVGEMSYSKFEGAVKDVEHVFFINIKSILNKINAFDEEDYLRIRSDASLKSFSNELVQTKMNIYNEYIMFVKDGIDDNEQILLKLDQLLLEISKFNTLEDGEIENMSAMKEIDELINKTKLYK